MPLPHLKTPAEIASMRAAGLLVWRAHQVAAGLIAPGVTTAAIDAAVEKFIIDSGASPLFKGVPGVVPFPATTCISVNEEVVHGIPGPRVLREGDIVTVDVGCRLDGWCSDAAMTHPVGEISPAKRKLLDVTEGALKLALSLMKPGERWSTIAAQLDRYVLAKGCFMVKDASGLGGHGIGTDLHEDPAVPNFTTREFERREDFTLVPGLVIAVEPMVNLGTSRIRFLPDYWTVTSLDRSPSAHFEHTIAMTKDGPMVLSAGPEGQGWAIDPKASPSE